MRQLWLAPALALATATGLDLEGIDRSVAPGDDFFRHANGTWLKTTEIPADRASYGPGAIVEELTTQRTAELVQQAAKAGAPQGSAAQRVGDYYASLVDQAAIDAKGLAPLQPRLDEIASIADRRALSRALGETLRADVDVLNATNFYTDNLLGLWVAQDLDDPSRYAPFLLQGGLDMPDREYYLDASPRMAEIRTKFQAHVARVLELAQVAGRGGTGRADRRPRAPDRGGARDARGRRRREEGRQPLDARPARRARPRPRLVGVLRGRRPRAAAAVRRLAAARRHRPLGPRRRAAARDVEGLPEPSTPSSTLPPCCQPPSARSASPSTAPCSRACRSGASGGSGRRTRPAAALGEAVGRLYVERYFPAEAKARIEGMVKNLMAAFGRRIDALDWMDAGHQGEGQGEAGRAQGRRRLPRSLARLLGPAGRARRRVRQRAARRAVRAPAQPREARAAGRSLRVGDDAADRQRGQPAGA